MVEECERRKPFWPEEIIDLRHDFVVREELLDRRCFLDIETIFESLEDEAVPAVHCKPVLNALSAYLSAATGPDLRGYNGATLKQSADRPRLSFQSLQ